MPSLDAISGCLGSVRLKRKEPVLRQHDETTNQWIVLGLSHSPLALHGWWHKIP
jgi:hypothetical protein